MTSLQAKIAKKVLNLQLFDWTAGSIAEQRSRQEKTARYARLPKDVHCRPSDIQGISAEWIEGSIANAGVILYLHGGAYALGSVNSHRDLITRLAVITQSKVLAINYRLAPEHPFPAALEDAVAAYRWLLAQGFDPARISIAGDSAGGGLTLATLIFLRDAQDPLPAGAVCISPWVDLALTGGSIRQNTDADPILNPERLERYATYYAGDHAKTFPLISPLYADLKHLPPLLIQVGTDEILLDDALRITENARQAGVEVALETWEGMFHVFQIISFLPETQKALEHIAGFLSQKMTFSNR